MSETPLHSVIDPYTNKAHRNNCGCAACEAPAFLPQELVMASPMAQAAAEEHAPTFDLIGHLERQCAFSANTFGPGARTSSVLDHIRKELDEIAKAPFDLEEWIDVVLLALDGAWRAGHSPLEIATALGRKQRKNESRIWPDWRSAPEGQAIEHVRDDEAVR